MTAAGDLCIMKIGARGSATATEPPPVTVAVAVAVCPCPVLTNGAWHRSSEYSGLRL